jgi:hypothetical protein
MSKKNRIGRLLAVFCLSVLTVVLTARASSPHGSAPVTVQGAATLVGQPVSQLVSLICNSDGPCTTPQPFGRNGPVFIVPTGEALVITDVQFKSLSFDPGSGDPLPPGSDANIDLETETTQGPITQASFYALTDTKGIFAANAQMTTGVVAPAGSDVRIFGNNLTGSVQGYLVPNP